MIKQNPWKFLVQASLVLALIGATIFSGGMARAAGKSVDNVTFAIAVNPPDQGQVFAYVPKGAGFFDKERLNVSFQPNAGGGAALKQLAAGNADFAISSPENLLNGLAGGMDLRAIATIITSSIYSMGILSSSSIKSVKELKGKKIGVSAFTSGSYPIAQATVAEAGLDPKNDVQFVIVGTGGPALQALQSGQVDAISTTDTQFAIFKTLGGKIKFLPKAKVNKLPGDQILVRSSFLVQHPAVAVRFARAVLEGIVCAQANPAKAITYFEQQYPEVANAVSKKDNLMIMQSRLNNMKLIKAQNGKWGYIPLKLYEQVQEEGLQLGTIQKEQNLQRIMTNNYIKQIDSFSPSKIAAQCKGKKK